MANPERRTELYVGLFFLLGLVLLGGLIVQFGRFSDRLTNHYPITVIFDDASGLIKGSEVRMGGARIGKVAEAPELNEAVKVQVILSIDERIRIPSGSNIQIDSASLLGDKLIVITPPAQKTDVFLQPEQIVQGGAPSGLQAIQNKAQQVTDEVLVLMQNAEGTFVKIDAAVDDLRAVTGRLGETIEKVNVSLLSDENLAAVDSMLANLDATSAEWKRASAELQPGLAEAREAIRSINKGAGSADKAMADLSEALKGVPRAVDSIASVGDEVNKSLQNGEGLLGTLTSDKEVSTDFSTFMRNVRQRGILRYRDAEMKKENDPRNRFQGKRR
jgi:phospholipid/cholesterol/gamma-HCH transport system substrate-binding protein